jgi:hypothetical protein
MARLIFRKFSSKEEQMKNNHGIMSATSEVMKLYSWIGVSLPNMVSPTIEKHRVHLQVGENVPLPHHKVSDRSVAGAQRSHVRDLF